MQCYFNSHGRSTVIYTQMTKRRTIWYYIPGHLLSLILHPRWVTCQRLLPYEAFKSQCETTLLSLSPMSEKAKLCFTVPNLRPLVLMITLVIRCKWVWSSGGMVLTGENWSTRRETLYSVGGGWMNGHGALVKWYWQGKTEVLGEKHYIVRVVGEWMGMEHWWNGTDRGKLKYWERNII